MEVKGVTLAGPGFVVIRIVCILNFAIYFEQFEDRKRTTAYLTWAIAGFS